MRVSNNIVVQLMAAMFININTKIFHFSLYKNNGEVAVVKC